MGPEDLEAKIRSLPEAVGVYLLKDARGRVIYIGKARNLSSRVRFYFQTARSADHKTEVLKDHIGDLDYILTDNELEALLLESTLVKNHKPKFNVNLKDDKAFLHIKLTLNEPYPRVLLTRRVVDDGALYFGPYLPASLARSTVKIINRHFLLRTCDLEIDGGLDRPCLEYYIKRCLGPCVAGLCTRDQYAQAVRDVVLLLEGKNRKLIESLKRKMSRASEKRHYEAAAFYRDRIGLVRDLAEKQKMILGGASDADIFAYYREGQRLALQLFTLRSGKIVGKHEFYWEDLAFFHPQKFLRDALQQYYLQSGFVPREIYLPAEIEDWELLARWLTERRAHKGRRGQVRLRIPRRGSKLDLLLLVEKNARIAFDARFRILRSEKQKLLQALKEDLDLAQFPERIEGFDVSNIQGAETVASLVVCEGGVMKKSDYRKFKLRTVSGPDDFSAIYEVVSRRYRRLLKESRPLPDLILIDGGKGQLHFAYQALSELDAETIALASIAKREEHIFVQGQDEPVILERTSNVLHLLQHIRDEAHRFAVTYHRKRRSLRDFSSALDRVPGVGEKRRKRLLRNFGSVRGVRQATLEELIPYVGEKVARRIKEVL